jgi:branched-chain amino acid transport system ATP-binding protein
MMLEVENLHVYYGNIHALKGLSLNVREGEIVTLIGANGAGKTTLLAAIMNQIPSAEGSVAFMGRPTKGMAPPAIVRQGMTMVPEGRRVFPRTSVEDNLLLGAYARRDKAGIKKDLQSIYEAYPVLGQRRRQMGGTLSGGEQQMLAIGRALMSRPKLMLLDEPSMGLSPLMAEQVSATIKGINEDGTTILLVEQNANQALQVSHRGYVIEIGEVVLADSAEALRENEQVKAAYLGG